MMSYSKTIAACFAVMSILPVVADARPAVVDYSYKLTFDDEFDSGKLDKTKWSAGFAWADPKTHASNPFNPDELALYMESQVTFEPRKLVFSMDHTPDGVTYYGKHYPYMSGMINTYGKFAQAYGYFESRVCLEGDQFGRIYNWPAFWAVTTNGPYGELDVMEGMTGMPAYHFHLSASRAVGASVFGMYVGCHRYGALWVPGKVTYFYDDKQVGLVYTDNSQPQSIVVNYATGGCCSGKVVVPSKMRVGYVRVWSNDPKAVAVRGNWKEDIAAKDD